MAAALRSVSRKISSGALQRALQQPRFSAGASAAVKEGQRMLLPRISRHGGTSLRRFSSNEAQAPNLLNSNKVFTQFPSLVQFTESDLASSVYILFLVMNLVP
jgi:hypothetical protein